MIRSLEMKYLRVYHLVFIVLYHRENICCILKKNGKRKNLHKTDRVKRILTVVVTFEVFPLFLTTPSQTIFT